MLKDVVLGFLYVMWLVILIPVGFLLSFSECYIDWLPRTRKYPAAYGFKNRHITYWRVWRKNIKQVFWDDCSF